MKTIFYIFKYEYSNPHYEILLTTFDNYSEAESWLTKLRDNTKENTLKKEISMPLDKYGSCQIDFIHTTAYKIYIKDCRYPDTNEQDAYEDNKNAHILDLKFI